MDNHQAELADQLEEDGLVYKADPASVIAKLEEVVRGDKGLRKLEARTEGLLLEVIDDMLMM
jgi:UDP-N-acetylglucosamine transferase subunit ALG13